MEGVEDVARLSEAPLGLPWPKPMGTGMTALPGAGGRGSSPPNLELVVFAHQNAVLGLGDPGQVTPQSNFTWGMKLGVVVGNRWWWGDPLGGALEVI